MKLEEGWEDLGDAQFLEILLQTAEDEAGVKDVVYDEVGAEKRAEYERFSDLVYEKIDVDAWVKEIEGMKEVMDDTDILMLYAKNALTKIIGQIGEEEGVDEEIIFFVGYQAGVTVGLILGVYRNCHTSFYDDHNSYQQFIEEGLPIAIKKMEKFSSVWAKHSVQFADNSMKALASNCPLKFLHESDSWGAKLLVFARKRIKEILESIKIKEEEKKRRKCALSSKHIPGFARMLGEIYKECIAPTHGSEIRNPEW